MTCQVQQLVIAQEWKDYENNPVITMGDPGTWDAGALGSMTVLKVGETYHMYYEAWGVRTEEEWDAEEYTSLQIGHATSSDGITWTKDPANPVIPKGAKGNWDANGTWDPFVLYEAGQFKMWYGGGQEICDWGYAVSTDGSSFEKKGRLSLLGGVEDNHVVHDKDSGKYYMYYWDRAYEPLGLFRAESRDESHFDFKNADNITIENDYEEEMYKFTHVFKVKNLWYMLYADFVRPHCDESKTRLALSVDGLNWKSFNQELFAGHDAEVLPISENLVYVYYGPNGYFDRKDCDIRLMIFNGEIEELW
jgi:hypothetical protein